MSLASLGGTSSQLSQIQLGSNFVGSTAYAFLDSVLDLTIDGRSMAPLESPPRPQPRLLIAFEADPTEMDPAWTDVTHRLQSFSVRRGRSHELDRFEAGTCTFTLFDSSRDFDPSYASSPYAPYVKPMRRVKLEAQDVASGIWYPLFTGFVEKIQPRWELLTGYVTFSCVDAFKLIARKNLNGSRISERADLRINWVLDQIGWTTTYWSLGHPTLSVLNSTTKVAGSGDDTRILSVANTTIQAATFDEESALNHIQAVTLAENGRLWIRGDGVIVFLDRVSVDAEQDFRSIFGDRGDEIPYRDLAPDYGDDTIYNEIRVERSGGTVQTASDSASQSEFLTRTLSRTGMLMSNDTEALASAQWLLGRYSQPILRFTSLSVDGLARWGAWREILKNDIGDQILIRRRPDGVTTPIEQQSVIEGISYDYNSDDMNWSTSWQLSPAFVTTRWLLGDPTDSVLGSTTIVTY